MSKFFGKVRGVGPDRLSKSAVSALVVMSHHGSAHSGAPAAIGNVPSFTGAGSPSMVELTSPVAVQPLDERGCKLLFACCFRRPLRLLMDAATRFVAGRARGCDERVVL